MYFTVAPFDRSRWRRLYLTVGLLAAYSLFVYWFSPRLLRVIWAAAAAVGIAEAAAESLMLRRFSPRGYSLGPDGLRIDRPARPVQVSLSTLRSARRVEAKMMKGWPVWGFRGFLGCVGYFYYRPLGYYRAYVTNKEKLVLVEADRPYLLSPDDTEEFLRQFRLLLPESARRETSAEPAPLPRGRMPRFVPLVAAGYALLLAGPSLYFYWHRPHLEMPERLALPVVVFDRGLVEKVSFYEDADLDQVTDIRYGQLRRGVGPELALVGEGGAVFLDEHQRPSKTVKFDWRLTRHKRLVDLEGDGVPEFLSGGDWSDEVMVLNLDGSVRWTYASHDGADDVAAGDVDGDGVDEIVVGMNGDGGVHLLDAKGKKLWQQPDANVWHVEIVDTDGDGAGEILHSSVEYPGNLVIRDRTGRELDRRSADVHLSWFSLARWPGNDRGPYIIAAADELISMMDFSGHEIRSLKAPHSWFLGEAHGTSFRGLGGTGYFAALVDYGIAKKRATLYIYNSDEEFVYQEILPESCAAIAAISSGAGETLLVGCKGKVWSYSWKGTQPHTPSR